MRAAIAAVGVIVLSAVLAPSLVAQWPAFPTAGIPRTADGKPDLTAPAPRTSDGKPDLSGIWNYAGILGFRGRPPDPPPGTPPEATFWNIEAGFKEGLPFQPWAAELRKQRMAVESKDNPDAPVFRSGTCSCTRTRSHGRSFRPGSDRHHLRGQCRRPADLHGRPPRAGQRSAALVVRLFRGWWEGDTLIVETTNFRDDGWLDVNGAPLTSAGKLVERFRRPISERWRSTSRSTTQAYTKPWTVRVNQRLLVDTELIEFVCLENRIQPGQVGGRSYAMCSISTSRHGL